MLGLTGATLQLADWGLGGQVCLTKAAVPCLEVCACKVINSSGEGTSIRAKHAAYPKLAGHRRHQGGAEGDPPIKERRSALLCWLTSRVGAAVHMVLQLLHSVVEIVTRV